MTPKSSILIFQLIYHPFEESLKSVLSMDFTGLRVDIFYALYNSRQGSQIISKEEYFSHGIPDMTSEYYANHINAQTEKTLYMKKLCLENNYDYALFCTDDVLVERDALQKLIAQEKDFIHGLMCYEKEQAWGRHFSGRIYDPKGPQDSDDRPIELHRDFEYGDIIKATFCGIIFALISRKILEMPDFGGFYESLFCKWLEQHSIPLLIHTGVILRYLGVSP